MTEAKQGLLEILRSRTDASSEKSDYDELLDRECIAEIERLEAENKEWGFRFTDQNILLREQAKVIEAVKVAASSWDKADDLLLACGEMSAQELRTARAVIASMKDKILSIIDAEGK